MLIGLLLVPVGHLAAQPQRTRTLTYEPELRKWAEQSPPTPGTPEAEMFAVKAWNRVGKYRKAFAALKRLGKTVNEEHSLYPDFLIVKAEAQIGKRQFYEAHLTLQEFLNRYAGIALTSEALRLEFVIAETFLSGVKRKLYGIRLLSGEETAFAILDEISTDHADSPLAELAVKTMADHMFDTGDHTLAEFEYARLLREYPQSRYAQFALRRSAEAVLARFEGPPYDETPLVEAEERYHDYRLRFRGAADREGVGSILESIREMRAEKDFSVGAYYERTDHLSSAVYYYRSVNRDWPGTIAATKAATRLELLGASEPARSEYVSPPAAKSAGRSENSGP